MDGSDWWFVLCCVCVFVCVCVCQGDCIITLLGKMV